MIIGYNSTAKNIVALYIISELIDNGSPTGRPTTF